MDIEECAEHIKIKVSTIYKWSCAGTIPKRYHGGKLVFHRGDIDAWSAARVKRTRKAPSQSKFQSARQRVRSLTTEYTPNRRQGPK